jgi:6-phosphogluconolactonase (cycloisomerase 2 family)
VTGYAVSPSGALTLLDEDGVTGTTGAGPIDVALSVNSRFMYVLNSGSMSVSTFRVNGDGSLDPVGDSPTVPAGSVGVAAR